MPLQSLARHRRTAAVVTAAALLLALSACASGSATSTSASVPATASSGLPSSHVHGLSVNAETGQILLATHEGLFDISTNTAVKIGATNDLMGFTPTMEEGVFYASGHPGQGSSLPSPLGLIKTTDGGRTWDQLSRQGESDFHALTMTKSGIVGHDGTMRTSADGKNWKTVPVGFAPAVLAGNPYSETVLATTREGVQRSVDGGNTWTLNSAAPLIQFAAFASATDAVGIAPDGAVYISPDAGATWKNTGRIEGGAQALAASEGSEGSPWIWAATPDGLVVSTDGGATFRPADAA
ncbi:exo-alpha-sialidase [Arthrobacter sp. CC3]|uniref:F510_1955 family glycosylhydrolase n=1 Tax=Arthrobacter sp. CC3 TaxID=3029185 RepID=UPI003267492A